MTQKTGTKHSSKPTGPASKTKPSASKKPGNATESNVAGKTPASTPAPGDTKNSTI